MRYKYLKMVGIGKAMILVVFAPILFGIGLGLSVNDLVS